MFRPVAGPSSKELQRLVERMGAHVGEVLGRGGLIERDIENAWLTSDIESGPLDGLIGHSIAYRIAVGPRARQHRDGLAQEILWSPRGSCRFTGARAENKGEP